MPTLPVTVQCTQARYMLVCLLCCVEMICGTLSCNETVMGFFSGKATAIRSCPPSGKEPPNRHQ